MIFLTGGARSGKSSVATSLAEQAGVPVSFVATARADDEEMERRIEEHRLRRPPEWTLVEAPIEVNGALRSAPDGHTVVIDCVTLWISNLMVELDDASISAKVGGALELIEGRAGESIVVSNEVGSGLVPMSPVGRRFRDLQGRANQSFAAAADRAYLVVAGRALRLDDFDDVV